MPLPNIVSGKTARCSAKCKATGTQCKNPASAAWGCKTCRYHGARKPETIRRGTDHWNYHHGTETLAAKAERSRRLAELRVLEQATYALGLATGARWRGRKPTYGKK